MNDTISKIALRLVLIALAASIGATAWGMWSLWG
jgi:hypothetical protein